MSELKLISLSLFKEDLQWAQAKILDIMAQDVNMATVTGCQSNEWIKRTENIWDPGREKEKNEIVKEKRSKIVNDENSSG